jgi:CoA-disulfide reductase
MGEKIVIVGGVAGGASVAARLRRLNENVEIILFEKGEYISFANCGLPYHIGEVIPERESLLVQTIEGMKAKFNLDIRNFSEVIYIDKEKKRVGIKKVLTNDYYEESYDTLILSPGAKPLLPPILGIDQAKNLFTLRNIPDTDQIKQYIHTHHPKSAVVIGGGFIGLEMVENLKHLGLEVTLVENAIQVMPSIDYEMASILHEHLLQKGIHLFLNDGVKAFKDEGKHVCLQSGKELKTDLIILSVGVSPETAFAKEAGLAVNERGALLVDAYFQTSDPSIYAIGDAISAKHSVSKEPCMIPLAWPANRQGRLLADNLCGRKRAYKGALGSSVAKVFDYTVASTGLNEKMLQTQNLPYKALHIHPFSHASYYPGATPVSFKLLFNPETASIYGAQGIGIQGVEKRIDLMATAIKADFTVYDLQDIEPCYAPPYNSAKDPVNMMGYYAANLMEGLVETMGWENLEETIRKTGAIVLDVREGYELVSGTLPNTVHIPLGELRERLHELPQDKPIYSVCQVGLRGYVACRMLMQQGFSCKNIDGGIRTYFNVKHAELLLNQ